MSALYPNETPLDDDYAVYGDYFYVVDGRVERSDVFGNVRDLRRSIIRHGRSAEIVCRCNIVARQADRERAQA